MFVQKTSGSNVNLETVLKNVGENPGTSIWRREQQLQISRGSLQHILTDDLLRLHAKKVQSTQELKPNDNSQRRKFTEWII